MSTYERRRRKKSSTRRRVIWAVVFLLVFVVGIGSYLAGRQLLLRLRADARSSSLGMEGRRRATAV